MLTSRYYKLGALLVCFFVAIGNFFPETPIYGFDRYIIGLPFGYKSTLSFVLIVIVATYPFVARKSAVYDHIYAAISCFIFSFLFLHWYVALRNLLAGTDLISSYQQPYGEAFSTNSIFFPYVNRLVLLAIFSIHVLMSLRLAALTWKEIAFISWAVVVSVITVVAR